MKYFLKITIPLKGKIDLSLMNKFMFAFWSDLLVSIVFYLTDNLGFQVCKYRFHLSAFRILRCQEVAGKLQDFPRQKADRLLPIQSYCATSKS